MRAFPRVLLPMALLATALLAVPAHAATLVTNETREERFEAATDDGATFCGQTDTFTVRVHFAGTLKAWDDGHFLMKARIDATLTNSAGEVVAKGGAGGKEMGAVGDLPRHFRLHLAAACVNGTQSVGPCTLVMAVNEHGDFTVERINGRNCPVGPAGSGDGPKEAPGPEAGLLAAGVAGVALLARRRRA